MKGKTVLITGVSGLVGRALAETLTARGYIVSGLSRTDKPIPFVQKVYCWQPEKNQVDLAALESADYIVNLAGAGIAEQRWSDGRKKYLLTSRTNAAHTLKNAIAKLAKKPSKIIAASAVGYYGAAIQTEPKMETSPAATDFLGQTCLLWEKAQQEMAQDIPMATVRIGIVLAKQGGALPKMLAPAKIGLGAPLGSGLQQMPWIHLADLCHFILHLIENEILTGPYNASATEACTNREFMKTLCKTIGKPYWPIGVPSIALRLILGEMADIVLGGCAVSNRKLHNSGYKLLYGNLEAALSDLIGKH